MTKPQLRLPGDDTETPELARAEIKTLGLTQSDESHTTEQERRVYIPAGTYRPASKRPKNYLEDRFLTKQ